MSKNIKEFNNLRLSYNIPQLGKIDAFLCADFSVACYNNLKI